MQYKVIYKDGSVLAGSVALIGFGADSAIEVISAVGLLWRLSKAGPHAAVSEESAAEKRALYVVAITFFLLAIYISLGSRKVAHQSGGAADIPDRDHLGGAIAGGHAGSGLLQAAGGQGDGKPRPGCRVQGDARR